MKEARHASTDRPAVSMPTWDEITLPLLRHTGGTAEATLRGTIDSLADEFGLSVELRNELLPSGKQTRFANRVGWAKTYLQKAGLLRSSGRGKFQIEDEGKRLLLDPPPKIDVAFLLRYPKFQAFRALGTGSRPSESRSSESQSEPRGSDSTPLEEVEANYQILRDQLAEEILEKVLACSPAFFERLVVELMVAMGYGGSHQDAGRALGGRGDGGVDGIIKEDRLGLDTIYLQAKRWEGTVGRPVVQAFAGSLEGFRARKGVFITTSNFSNEAREYVKLIEKRIILIDGQELAHLLIDNGVGVSEEARYVIHKIDNDFFSDSD